MRGVIAYRSRRTRHAHYRTVCIQFRQARAGSMTEQLDLVAWKLLAWLHRFLCWMRHPSLAWQGCRCQQTCETWCIGPPGGQGHWVTTEQLPFDAARRQRNGQWLQPAHTNDSRDS